MSTLQKAFNSTVGRKLIMGLSGLALVLFIIVHLIENLLLYGGPGAYNAYVETLQSFGWILTIAEIGLASLFLIHAVLAIRITKTNHDARGSQRYAMNKSKGDPSRSSVASRNMIWTGVILLAFLVYHIWQFRFGPGMSEGYIAQVGNQPARDLYRLVLEVFSHPLHVGIYLAVMIFLGAHIRHGFWSAFQSLGAMTPKLSKPIYAMGLLLGLILALGFITIPLWFYIGGGRA